MSFESDVGLTKQHLKHANPKLRDRVLEKYARIKGLGLLRTQRMFSRDSKRLDAKVRATYAKLGLPVEAMSDDDETVLGDKITYSGATTAAAILGGAAVVAGTMWAIGNKPDAPPEQPPAIQDTDTRSTVRPT